MKALVRTATGKANQQRGRSHAQRIAGLQVSESSALTLFPNLSGPVRDTPPCRAIPFRDSIGVSQRGVSHPFALFSEGIAQVSLRYLFCRGGGCRTSTLHALQVGNAQKRGRGYRTQVAMLRHQIPHSAQ